MTAVRHPTPGKENEPPKKLGTLFLWTALFMVIPLGRLRDLFGPGALVCGYVVFVALLAAAAWRVGATKANAGLIREQPPYLPGVLLLAGPLALLLGASVTGNPRRHVRVTTCSTPRPYSWVPWS